MVHLSKRVPVLVYKSVKLSIFLSTVEYTHKMKHILHAPPAVFQDKYQKLQIWKTQQGNLLLLSSQNMKHTPMHGLNKTLPLIQLRYTQCVLRTFPFMKIKIRNFRLNCPLPRPSHTHTLLTKKQARKTRR